MIIQDYIDYWDEQNIELEKIKPESVHTIPLPVDILEFLSMVGLPKEAAPYLTFNITTFPAFTSPDDLYDLEDRPDLSDWFIIGETGESNPICIDPMNGYRICYVETENDFKAVFMNSSLDKLAICIYLYEKFIENYSTEESENLVFADADWEYLKKQFIEIDPEALAEGSFWDYYLEYLLVDRED
ncbi:SUKH-4 family immunity protein [Cytophaga aurantiaca]|uniref:SUKH-4 family immunity protein n=1 Tax=Cytophaga aurantiaca TaxID=29530 RepID=UPI00037625E4|nr:SUKH-4 family immunity protein [Cytophaga aurantiaca]